MQAILIALILPLPSFARIPDTPSLQVPTTVHTEDAFIRSSDTVNVNLKGMGYYHISFYSGSTCSGTPSFQEGYATGRCLSLSSTTGSVRMDCSASGQRWLHESLLLVLRYVRACLTGFIIMWHVVPHSQVTDSKCNISHSLRRALAPSSTTCIPWGPAWDSKDRTSPLRLT